MLSPSVQDSSEPVEAVRGRDSELIQLLREGEPQSIDDLKQALGVTATAVRQRLERLLEAGLVERQKVILGRGRPVFRYALTVDGHRHAGADASEFAEAMWREIMCLRDSPIRRRLISAIARRLGKMYAARLHSSIDGVSPVSEHAVESHAYVPRTLEERMRSLTNVLTRQQIRAGVHITASSNQNLPVLDIGACPFPTLRDHPSDRSLCKMEEEMLSEALGAPVHLTSCRLDGDHCCQFTPAVNNPSSGNNAP